MPSRGSVIGGETSTPDVETQFQAVIAQMKYMSGRDGYDRFRAPDEYMAHIFEESSEQFGAPGNEILDNTFLEAIERHPHRTAANWAHLWARHFHNYLLLNGGITEESVSTIRPLVQEIKHNPDARARLQRNADFNVRTNIADRSSLLKIIAFLRGPESPLHILDIGGGEGHNAKKLLYHAYPKRKFPYRDIDLFDLVPGGHGLLESNPIDSLIVNSIVQKRPLPIGSIVGIDLYPPLTGQNTSEAEERRLWDISCYYLWEHLKDPERIAEYPHWELQQFDNHFFVQADVTNLDPNVVRAVQPEVKTYDIAYLSYSAYQMGYEGLQAARDRLEPLLVSEDGEKKGCIIMTDDGAIINEAGEIQFTNETKKWSTGTFIYDFADEKPEWYEVIRARSGRIGRALLMPSFARLPLAREYGLRSDRAAA